MKLVHKPLTPWISICVLLMALSGSVSSQEAQPPHTVFYSPDKGFNSSQTSLTKIFLQLAGSMEHHGSPEPYIRHMQAEHKRITALFEQKTGKPHRGRMPAHMTDEYLNRFIANWNALSPKLGLDQLAKDAGRFTREALQGPDNNGTFIIEILNLHQEEIVSTMKQKGENGTFEDLRSILAYELGFNTESAPARTTLTLLVEREKALTDSERKTYASLLKHDRFSKAEFSALERFYEGGYDKLTEEGKAEMSKRISAGKRGNNPPDTRTDALKAAKAFRDIKVQIFEKIEAVLSPSEASQIKKMVDGFFLDMGYLAHSEFEVGMLNWAIQ